MKTRIFVPTALAIACSTAFAEETNKSIDHVHVEQVTVYATPFEDRISETMLPVNVLQGDELKRKVGTTLGDALKNEPGVHSQSFGNGVGQPVIRGQTGNRVQVVQAGVSISDASDVSPDHANAVEPLLADRIEVLRGPSTLLYGNGAIGGVVNIVDGRIPQSLDQDNMFVGEQTYDSVNDENRTLVRLDGAFGNLALHFDGVTRDNENVEIPGLANMDPDAEENTDGFVDNSFGEGESFHFGASLIGEKGLIGFSAGRVTSNYGLPPGVHEHEHGEEHDHGEEHEGEEHDEDHEEHEGEEEEVAIRLDMETTRYDIKAHYDFDGEFLKSFDAHIGFTDYEHSEIEFEGDEVEIGTTYTNEGFSSRFTLSHGNENWDGVAGIQFGQTEFSAVGEEAYIVPADIDSAALFVVERLTTENIDWEFGARIEQLDIDPTGDCSNSETTSSLSASGRWQFLETSDLLVSLSNSERAPTVEERYSNVTGPGCTRPLDNEELVLHAATDLLEVGNPNLDTETSNNIEVGLRHYAGNFSASLNLYYNQIDNYVYLAEEGEFEGEMIAVYQGRDATFKGFEVKLDARLADLEFGVLEAEIFGDVARAVFDDGTYVPRMSPVRIGGELSLSSASTSAGITYIQAFDQNRAGEDESATEGYVNLGAYADYSFALAGGEMTVFLRGENLLDEDIRLHTSLLKEAAPEPGRSVSLGVRLAF